MWSRREYVKALLALPWASASAAQTLGGQAGASSEGGWPLWASRAGQQFYFDARTPEGYQIARYLLRDIRAGGVMGWPDPWLLRALAQMQYWWAQYGRHVRIDFTSGLRLPSTNASIEGAARASLHLPRQGGRFYAADFRVGRANLLTVAQWARAAGISGLGLYVERDFLHADMGRVRHWIGR